MTGVYCKDCMSSELDPQYEIDRLYVCAKCKKIIAYSCSECGRVFYTNRLGLHGNVYECKICGHIQWGYTEWKRNQEANKSK